MHIASVCYSWFVSLFDYFLCFTFLYPDYTLQKATQYKQPNQYIFFHALQFMCVGIGIQPNLNVTGFFASFIHTFSLYALCMHGKCVLLLVKLFFLLYKNMIIFRTQILCVGTYCILFESYVSLFLFYHT